MNKEVAEWGRGERETGVGGRLSAGPLAGLDVRAVGKKRRSVAVGASTRNAALTAELASTHGRLIAPGNERAGRDEALAGARRPIGQLEAAAAARHAGPSGKTAALYKALKKLATEERDFAARQGRAELACRLVGTRRYRATAPYGAQAR
jgi:hypothetical protein